MLTVLTTYNNPRLAQLLLDKGDDHLVYSDDSRV